jgi:hypothetical protein
VWDWSRRVEIGIWTAVLDRFRPEYTRKDRYLMGSRPTGTFKPPTSRQLNALAALAPKLGYEVPDRLDKYAASLTLTRWTRELERVRTGSRPKAKMVRNPDGPASKKQLETLSDLGVDTDEPLTRARASELIQRGMTRRDLR